MGRGSRKVDPVWSGRQTFCGRPVFLQAPPPPPDNNLPPADNILPPQLSRRPPHPKPPPPPLGLLLLLLPPVLPGGHLRLLLRAVRYRYAGRGPVVAPHWWY